MKLDFEGIVVGAFLALVLIHLLPKSPPKSPPKPKPSRPPPRPHVPAPPKPSYSDAMNLEFEDLMTSETPPQADDVDADAVKGIDDVRPEDVAMLVEQRPGSDRDIDFAVKEQELFDLERDRAPKVYRDESRRS